MTRTILTLMLVSTTFVFAQNSKFVNVFIGTDGTGHTFPGPSMPFGMVQPGFDTFPFTGRKDSAEGTLSVEDALRAFSIRTLVATKDTPANKAIVNTIVETHSSKFLSTKFIF